MTGARSGREKECFKYFKLKISIRHSSGDRKKLDTFISTEDLGMEIEI